MNKLEARALFYAIMVAFFVAVISGIMLLNSYHQHVLFNHYTTQQKLLHNCESGVQLLLGAGKEQIPSTVLDLYEKGTDSVRIIQQPWGLLDVAFVESWSSQGIFNDTIRRSFFIGKKPPAYALTLSEGTDALALCGHTQLVGDIFVPREGVERGFINGKPYQGNKLVDGKISITKSIDNSYLKPRFEQLMALQKRAATETIERDTIEHSFGKPTLVLRAPTFYTAGLSLKGNIIIIADSLLTIAANSILDDVIVMGTTIRIEQGFQGTVQAFARDSLIVENDVVLAYPSMLSLLPTLTTEDFAPWIELQDGCVQTGAIVVPMFKYREQQPKVHLHPKATVEGQVWVNGLFQHDGTVYGSVFCESFLLKTAAAVYENYLLDAIINRKALSPYYLAPPILGKPSKRGILKLLE